MDCPRWPSLVAVVDKADREVVVLVGVPLQAVGRTQVSAYFTQDLKPTVRRVTALRTKGSLLFPTVGRGGGYLRHLRRSAWAGLGLFHRSGM